MNSLPYFLFLSLLLCRECRNIEGVKQNKIEEDDRVVGTDGTDLHKIFEEQARRNHPTTSATLTDEEEEKDLQTAPATGLKDDSEKGQDSTFLSVESGSRLSKDGTGEQIESERSEISKNHKKRLTSGNSNVLEEKNRDSEKQDNNIRTGRKNNHENAESRRDGGSSHGNLIKDRAELKSGHNKLAQRAQKGKAELESSSKFEAQNSPDSNLSKSTPPPFIKKVKNTPARAELDDIYFLFIVIGCSVAGIAGLALAGYCWYKLHTTAKAVSEAEYSGYGTSKQTLQVAQGDNKLDYSAEMYHYHQTKSQLSAMEKASGTKSRIKGETLEDDDDNSDEGDEEDFTVYECHGLAPTGDMTVVNPLFSDQEVVGSDQDGNGDRSGASGQGSPVPLRHSPKES